MTLIKGMLTTAEVRESQSFQHAREVAKPFGALDEIIVWCKAELQNEWRWQLIRTTTDRDPGRYIFYFDSDRDACAFALKWA